MEKKEKTMPLGVHSMRRQNYTKLPRDSIQMHTSDLLCNAKVRAYLMLQEGLAMCAVCAPLCIRLPFPDSSQQQHTMEQRQKFNTLMTSKGPVQTGPKQAAEKPEPIDWSRVSCMPSPSCLPHNKLQREHTAVANLDALICRAWSNAGIMDSEVR